MRRGQSIFILGARYDPRLPPGPQRAAQQLVEVIVEGVYLLMGRDLVPVEEAPAGSIVGITGLGTHVLKTATLSTTLACPAMSGLVMDARPIVRVALETERIADMPALEAGMRLLGQADPCVEVLLQETGEHVLVAAGEVHVERCLTDLRESFAPGISISVSEPIVPFRETVIEPPRSDVRNELIGAENETVNKASHYLLDGLEVTSDKVAHVTTQPNRRWTLRVRAEPLPASVTALLQKNEAVLRALQQEVTARRDATERRRRFKSGSKSECEPEDFILGEGSASAEPAGLESTTQPALDADEAGAKDASADRVAAQLYSDLKAAFSAAGPGWEGTVDRIWSFGPRHVGANMLVHHLHGFPVQGFFAPFSTARQPNDGDGLPSQGSQEGSDSVVEEKDHTVLGPAAVRELRRSVNSVEVGFQVLTQGGPLCEEPLQGVCFHLLGIDITNSEVTPPSDPGFPGSVIGASREACRQAFLMQPARLVAAMYACDLVVSSASLGRVYDVLGRRGGRVLSEEMKEGSDSFLVHAVLPVSQSFGFAGELRSRTSGLAVPQLIFSHWETIAEDPFWVPATETELEHYGDQGDAPNTARKLMDAVRRRKGLRVEEKIVEFAYKQRTMARKK